jgi:protein CpxP
MKTWMKRTLIGALGAATLAGGLTACGSRGEHHRGGWSEERIVEMRGKAIEKVGRKLELDAALGVLADALLAQRDALKGDGASPRAEMQALIAGERFDRSGAQALLERKVQGVQANGPRVITAMADFYDSLTPAQQSQVRERLEHRRGWWGRG